MINIPRVIPCLLLKQTGFVKTVRFADPSYLGDPINIVKLFNDMEVDELSILDISAHTEGRGPAFELLQSIADNAFMPMSYGGGVASGEDVRKILGIGYEKVVIGRCAVERPELIAEAARVAGSQSVVVSVDVRRSLLGKQRVCVRGGKSRTKVDPVHLAREVEQRGAGEILLTAIDRDGVMGGYDLDLIRAVTQVVGIPVIACGGAGKIEDFAAAVNVGGASAVAAGSLFVYHGRRRGVLVNFPSRQELEAIFADPAGGPSSLACPHAETPRSPMK